MELMRFFAVAAIGLIIDTGIAWILFHEYSVPLTLSSVCGFLIAAAANYIMHELWTFKNNQSTMSFNRALAYIGALILTLLIRIVVVHITQIFLFPDRFALLILIIAAGISFVVNFVASKFFVFKTKPSMGAPSP